MIIIPRGKRINNMLTLVTLSITTAADGSATVKSAQAYNGLLYGLKYVPGTLATGADLTIGVTQSEYDATILTITDAGTSEVSWYPRNSTCGATGTSNSDALVYPPVVGHVQVVVAQGGNATSGTLYAYILD